MPTSKRTEFIYLLRVPVAVSAYHPIPKKVDEGASMKRQARVNKNERATSAEKNWPFDATLWRFNGMNKFVPPFAEIPF